MRKLKEFYKRNRVYSILMLVSLLCVIAIITGVILYFITQTSKDKYGNRLDGIRKSKKEDIKKTISENELVKSVDINVKGRLIYIDIVLTSGKHADSEALALSILDLFSEEEKAFYDIQYIIDNEDKETEENFPVMGYIKKGNSVIKWTNYVG